MSVEPPFHLRPDENDFYRVIEESPGCPHCKYGALYMIVYTDEGGEEVATGTSYGGPGVANEDAREAAIEVASDLETAYQLGRLGILPTGGTDD